DPAVHHPVAPPGPRPHLPHAAPRIPGAPFLCAITWRAGCPPARGRQHPHGSLPVTSPATQGDALMAHVVHASREVEVIHTRYRAIHPIHAVFLAGIIPLFAGALLSDIAYYRTYEIQWQNFASWLIAGGQIGRASCRERGERAADAGSQKGRGHGA